MSKKKENMNPREAFQMSMFGKDAPCKEINGIYVSDGIEENKSIFRYMNLEYLYAMLRSGKLYIPNRQSFPDLREKGVKERFRNWGPLQIVRHSQEEQEEQVKKCQEEIALRRIFYRVCVSCWTFDEHEHPDQSMVHEDYLMWKAYASQAIGCRIETTVQDLIGSIKNTDRDFDLWLSKIHYAKESYGSFYDCLFQKTLYYKNEQELRLCALTLDVDHVELPINPMQLIKKITISPFIDKSYAGFLIRSLESEFPELAGKVETSHILEY